MRHVYRARLSAQLRTLINKRDRTPAEDAEMQQLLVQHRDRIIELGERDKRWRARRDELIRRLEPLAKLWERVVWPVAALWNTMMLMLHDALQAVSRRLHTLADRQRRRQR